MKIHVYLIATHLIMFMNSLSVVYFDCCIPVPEFNEIVECNVPLSNDSADFNDTLMRLPRNISNLTKQLDIHAYVGNETSVGIRLPIEIDCIDMFVRMPSLNFLIIMGRNFEISEELSNRSDQMQLLQKKLFNLANLNVLAISMNESSFSEANTSIRQWILPKSLKHLAIETTVEEYDLSGCPKLEILSVRFSNLTKLPPLYNPAPPIKLLRFVGCPLDELAANDVAKFCQLEKLIITSVKEAPYNVSIEKSRCVQLQSWITTLAEWKALEFIGKLTCADEDSTTESYPKTSLHEAMRFRMQCLEKVDPYRAFILYIAVAMAVLPMVFICVVNIRSYRKMHAKPPVSTTPASSKSESEIEVETSLDEDL